MRRLIVFETRISARRASLFACERLPRMTLSLGLTRKALRQCALQLARLENAPRRGLFGRDCRNNRSGAAAPRSMCLWWRRDHSSEESASPGARADASESPFLCASSSFEHDHRR